LDTVMTELERRPITDLLTEAAAALNAAEASDTTAVLTAAWRGFCIAARPARCCPTAPTSR